MVVATTTFLPWLKRNGTKSMKVEQVETRIAELRKSRDQILAQLHAHDGAIQEAEYWLNSIKSEEKNVNETKE